MGEVPAMIFLMSNMRLNGCLWTKDGQTETDAFDCSNTEMD